MKSFFFPDFTKAPMISKVNHTIAVDMDTYTDVFYPKNGTEPNQIGTIPVSETTSHANVASIVIFTLLIVLGLVTTAGFTVRWRKEGATTGD